MIVERALGDEFESLLSRHIWEPPALDDAFGWRARRNGDAKGFCCDFATARSRDPIGGQIDDDAIRP